MLILTRRGLESIMIKDGLSGWIEVKLLKIRGSQVHLGIDAPRKADIHRKEVWFKMMGINPEDAVAIRKAKAGSVGEESFAGEDI